MSFDREDTFWAQVVDIYDLTTIKIKRNIITYICILADIIIPTNLYPDIYNLVYTSIVKRCKNNVFL